MRNPWGKDQSYKGGWEKNSQSWRKVSQQVQDEVNSHGQLDGQFLISYSDFAAQFDEIDFVHIDFNAFYDSTDPNNSSSNWTSLVMYGAWVAGKNAGGCGNDDYRNYWLNPQYYFRLPPDSDGGKVAIIAALLQCDQVKNRLRNNGSFVDSNLPQAFTIYRIKDSAFDPNSKDKKYRENDLVEVGTTGVYVAKKEVSKRFEFEPGNYVIIPSLFDKGAEGTFVIRLFFESDVIDSSSLDMHKLRTDYQYQEQLIKEIEADDQAEAQSRPDEETSETQQHDGYDENSQYEQQLNESQYDGHRGRGRGRGGRGGRRRRIVDPPMQMTNYEEMGRFATFLSHPMSVNEVKQQVFGFVKDQIKEQLFGSGDDGHGRSIKGSRACSVM